MNKIDYVCVFVTVFLLIGAVAANAGESDNAVQLPYTIKGSEDSVGGEFSVSVNGSPLTALGFKGKAIPSTRSVSFDASATAMRNPVEVYLESTNGPPVGTALVKIEGDPAEVFTIKVSVGDSGFSVSAHWNKRFIASEIIRIFNEAKTGAMSDDQSRVISSARIAVDLKAADLLGDCLKNKTHSLRLEAWKTVAAVDDGLLRKAVALILSDDSVWDSVAQPGQANARKDFLVIVSEACHTWIYESGNHVESMILGNPLARRDMARKIFRKNSAPSSSPVPMP